VSDLRSREQMRFSVQRVGVNDRPLETKHLCLAQSMSSQRTVEKRFALDWIFFEIQSQLIRVYQIIVPWDVGQCRQEGSG